MAAALIGPQSRRRQGQILRTLPRQLAQNDISADPQTPAHPLVSRNTDEDAGTGVPVLPHQAVYRPVFGRRDETGVRHAGEGDRSAVVGPYSGDYRNNAPG